MASKIRFLILMVLNVNIAWTSASLSIIHKMMTLEEISQTFSTNDGTVPDYQVISMEVPGARRRRRANDEIFLNVEINRSKINLTFKPTRRHLVTKYTPVWLAVTDENAYNGIHYDPLPNLMEDIGEFEMYQDVDNDAAIVVYTDSERGNVIKGIVTSEFAINTLPRRFMDRTRFKVTGHYVLFKSSPSARNIQRNSEFNNRLGVKIPNGRRTIIEALRFMLAFWNGVEMVYSTLNDPKVYLTISGIIISADDAATPYIAKNTALRNTMPNEWEILIKLATYFGKELDRFPLKLYDMILAMTTLKICDGEDVRCQTPLESTSAGTACTSEQELIERKEINGVGIVNYNWMFGGVRSVVRETAHILDVLNDQGIGATLHCSCSDGYVMAATAESRHKNLKWSPCSVTFLRQFFSSKKSECLQNVPMSIMPVEHVLPGRWLSLDGQCQNIGFNKSCEIRDDVLCRISGCKTGVSNDCIMTASVPLPGTKCGEDKYCDEARGCIYE